MLATPTQLLALVSQWPVRSQQVARRNALVACTSLADRRREREDVEEFLERLARTRADVTEVAVRRA